jgi:hypothetical protein
MLHNFGGGDAFTRFIGDLRSPRTQIPEALFF